MHSFKVFFKDCFVSISSVNLDRAELLLGLCKLDDTAGMHFIQKSVHYVILVELPMLLWMF